MSKRPQDRYANGSAMAVALRESIKHLPNETAMGLSSLPALGGMAESGVRDELPGTDSIMDMVSPAVLEMSGPSTLLSHPRPVSEDDETVDMPAPKPPVLAETPPLVTGSGKSRSVFLILALALASVLLIALGWVLAMGVGAKPLSPALPMTQVPVEAHLTRDRVVWSEFSELSDPIQKAEYVDAQVRAGRAKPLNGGLIRALDGTTGALLDEQHLDADGEGKQMLHVSGNPESVKFVVSADATGHAVNDEFLLRTPGLWSQRQVFLLYQP